MPTPRWRPIELRPDEVRRRFRRGRRKPRAVAWYSVSEFWGHLFHFVASAIATEDIDSRDWMQPDRPNDLAAQAVRLLGGTHYRGNLVDSLDRDLWIDYLADTGDDTEVSEAVARLLFAEYEVADPEQSGETLVLPRGDLLIVGGDTAYPVATVNEINLRLIVPFNRVLKTQRDGKPRVLLGVAGNHDWYDGLDGFARLFRRREPNVERAMRADSTQIRKRTLNYYAEWAKEFMLGGQLRKPKAVVLDGYTPIQQASYFAMPLSAHLDLVAVDRQLRQVDFRQREFFRDRLARHPERARWLLLPDPYAAFGEPTPSGAQMIGALEAELDRRAHFVLAGDIHHYRRWRQGPSTHVVAGGGGAFLHPAPLHEPVKVPAEVSWPGPAQTRALLSRVPWWVAFGRSGFVPHLLLAVGTAPSIVAWWYSWGSAWRSGFAAALGLTTFITFIFIGGLNNRRLPFWLLALGSAITVGVLPNIVCRAAEALGSYLTWRGWGLMFGGWVVTVFVGALLFGAYLARLTRSGLQYTQAFTALAHPGFKHVMRFRLRRDGRTVDAWCIGMADPLREGDPVVLVDRFTWRC